MSMHINQPLSNQDAKRTALNKRLEDIGWGLFLMMFGVIWLMPEGQVPQGIWLVCAGLIMLGVNWVRYLNEIKMNGFTIALGILALAAGLGSFFQLKLPIFAIFLILIGASIILKPMFERMK